MGRRYYCEYCDKSFLERGDAVKKHRNGLQHQKLMKEHYANFKDRKVILEEESAKKPCNRYNTNGECPFGSMCRYTHYTKEQLDQLRWEVQESQIGFSQDQDLGHSDPTLQSWFFSRRERNLKDSTELSNLFMESLPSHTVNSAYVPPWNYPEEFSSFSDIPPSLRRF